MSIVEFRKLLKKNNNNLTTLIRNRNNDIIQRLKDKKKEKPTTVQGKILKKSRVGALLNQIQKYSNVIKGAVAADPNVKIKSLKQAKQVIENKKKEDRLEKIRQEKEFIRREIERAKRDLERLELERREREKELEIRVKRLMREKRIINTRLGYILQNPIKDITRDTMMSEYKDKDTVYLDQNFGNLVNLAREKLFSNPEIDTRLGKSHIQALYIYSPNMPQEIKDENGNITFEYVALKIYHSNSIELKKNRHIRTDEFELNTDESDIEVLFVGYKITYKTRNNLPIGNNHLRVLKAFYPVTDRNYHESTSASTTDEKICIYATFCDIVGNCKLKNMPKNSNKIRKMLEKEDKEIKDSVKNGELVNALELLTKKYKAKIIVFFYESARDKDDKHFIVDNGITQEITDEELKKYEGQKGMSYYKNLHVAPAPIKCATKKEIKQNKKYKMRFERLVKTSYIDEETKEVHMELLKSRKVNNILGFDSEAYKKEDGTQVPFSITLFGKLNNKKIERSYYGEKCVDNFVKYIFKISKRKSHKKSRPNESVDPIHIYGYNNSRYDNLFIYEKIHDKEPMSKYTMTENSIKGIKFNNILIHDINLFYAGKLKDAAKQFGLKIEKGVYPYKFANKNNLKYIGEVPEKKYFNNKKDYEECKNMIGEKSFNLEKYTKKYCMLDSKIVYEFAKLHIDECVSVIKRDNGQEYIYDAQKMFSSAGISLKIFKQVFMDDNLEQSPENVIINEHSAYKGGYTAVFKKSFKRLKKGKYLNGYDINSSYLSSMCHSMPFKFIKTIKCNNDIVNIDELVETDNYCASVKYIGNDKYFIPNLLVRDEVTTNTVGVKEADNVYFWGCELIEAINNGYEVRVNSIDTYEDKPIFNEFANYFYNKRLEAEREGNRSKSKFYKDIGNSLYGKWAQRQFTKKKIVNNYNEMYNILEKENGVLVSDIVINDRKIIFEYNDKNTKNDNDYGKLVRFSSYIAARSRVTLSEAMRNIGHEHIYYIDTDSIFTDKELGEEFISTKLGKWKVDKPNIQEGIFIAPKTYYLKYKDDDNNIKKIFKAKGLDKDRMTDKDFKKLLNGEEFEQSRAMFFRSFQRIQVIDRVRTIKGVYNKRIWEGNNSIAFKNIEEWRKSNESNDS
jgi:hypothetical protein